MAANPKTEKSEGRKKPEVRNCWGRSASLGLSDFFRISAFELRVWEVAYWETENETAASNRRFGGLIELRERIWDHGARAFGVAVAAAEGYGGEGDAEYV